MILQEKVALAPLTTLKVGGSAQYFVEAQTVNEVREAVELAASRQLPLFVLGGGSNLVIADAGWPGLVLRIAIPGIDSHPEGKKCLFEVGAGEDWDTFVAAAVEKQCAGIECLSGIPGTVGGTPVQNVGAYGQEVSQTITKVRALELKSGKIVELANAACEFGYRTSVFNSSRKGRYIVLQLTFELDAKPQPHIEYADLKNYFRGRSERPTLSETREAVRSIRLSKAMLIVPGDEDCRSAGSFFKNPILNSAEYRELLQRAERELPLPGASLSDARPQPQILPGYPMPDGRVKVSAAWLVENAGFAKGTSRGTVGISRRHSLAIINKGGATAKDIVAFKDEIQNGVADVFGVKLQPEPVFVGFE